MDVHAVIASVITSQIRATQGVVLQCRMIKHPLSRRSVLVVTLQQFDVVRQGPKSRGICIEPG